MLGLGSAIALGATGMGMSAGINRGESTLDSLSNYYFGGKSEKRSNERQEQMSKEMSMFEHALDWNYYKKGVKFTGDYNRDYYKDLYSWQSAFDYDYSRRYAENSAKWQTTGLRNAGLNPILAATDGNFRMTFGSQPSGIPSAGSGFNGASSSGISGHPSSGNTRTGSQPFDLPEAVRDLSSAELSNVSAKTAAGMMEPTINSAKADVKLKEANAEYQRAQALNVDANTAKTIAETVDIKHGGKVSGVANYFARLLSALPDGTNAAVAKELSDVKSLRAITTPSVEGSSSSAKRDGKIAIPPVILRQALDNGKPRRYNSLFTH